MRFSLTALLLATAVVALSAAAIVHRTSLWSNLVVTLTVSITVGCTITAWASPKRRSFCLPFAGYSTLPRHEQLTTDHGPRTKLAVLPAR